jgi:hypothetical protein
MCPMCRERHHDPVPQIAADCGAQVGSLVRKNVQGASTSPGTCMMPLMMRALTKLRPLKQRVVLPTVVPPQPYYAGNRNAVFAPRPRCRPCVAGVGGNRELIARIMLRLEATDPRRTPTNGAANGSNGKAKANGSAHASDQEEADLH